MLRSRASARRAAALTARPGELPVTSRSWMRSATTSPSCSTMVVAFPPWLFRLEVELPARRADPLVGVREPVGPGPERGRRGFRATRREAPAGRRSLSSSTTRIGDGGASPAVCRSPARKASGTSANEKSTNHQMTSEARSRQTNPIARPMKKSVAADVTKIGASTSPKRRRGRAPAADEHPGSSKQDERPTAMTPSPVTGDLRVPGGQEVVRGTPVAARLAKM